MTLPPLRAGSCRIGDRRYPTIVGKVQGRTRELFVCVLHVDRFIGTLPPAELWQLLQQGMELRADGDPL